MLGKIKRGPAQNTSQSTKHTYLILEICDNLDLVDAWRILYPEERRYTWRQTKPNVYCRLDFFLISQSLLGSTTSANILPGFKTDHSMISLKIIISSFKSKRAWFLET